MEQQGELSSSRVARAPTNAKSRVDLLARRIDFCHPHIHFSLLFSKSSYLHLRKEITSNSKENSCGNTKDYEIHRKSKVAYTDQRRTDPIYSV